MTIQENKMATMCSSPPPQTSPLQSFTAFLSMRCDPRPQTSLVQSLQVSLSARNTGVPQEKRGRSRKQNKRRCDRNPRKEGPARLTSWTCHHLRSLPASQELGQGQE